MSLDFVKLQHISKHLKGHIDAQGCEQTQKTCKKDPTDLEDE